MVAMFRAVGHGTAQIADELGVSEWSVRNDKEWLDGHNGPTSPEAAASGARGMAKYLITSVSDLLVIQTPPQDPATRMAAARLVWNIYKERVALEQAFGMMPDQPKVLEVEFGQAFQDYLKALTAYLTPNAGEELLRAMEAIDDEQPDLAAKVGTLLKVGDLLVP